jgi:hypothetical protein
MILRISWASQVDGSFEHSAFSLPLFGLVPHTDGNPQGYFHIFIAVFLCDIE